MTQLRQRPLGTATGCKYVTIASNSLECLVALIAGFIAGSITLVGFGFDSAIDVTSSLAALWRLRWDAEEATHGWLVVG